jgi:hypothetical protein
LDNPASRLYPLPGKYDRRPLTADRRQVGPMEKIFSLIGGVLWLVMALKKLAYFLSQPALTGFS